jgi:protease-4
MVFHLLLALARNALRLVAAPLTLSRRARACPPGAWVHLRIDGEVVEMRGKIPRIGWGQRPAGLALDRLRELVDTMIGDDAPAGLLVTIQGLGASAAFRSAIHGELARLRAAGRAVVVHLPSGGGAPELLLGAAASRLLLGAQSTLGPLGFAAGGMYLRGALDKLGLEPDVHAEGTYKTAGESLALEHMSEPQREQLGRLLDVLHDELVTALARGRKVERAVAEGWIDRGMIGAEDAVGLGLADDAVHDDEVARRLGVVPLTEDAKMISPAMYLRNRRSEVFVPLLPRKRIAVIEAHGPIMARSPSPLGNVCDAEQVVRLVEAAAEADDVAGVVMHLDTPGGGVLASEKIHRAVAQLAKKKPVVACFGGVSASGGYYVASACHSIVARETTITGSIGVVATRLLTGKLLDRIGVHSDVVVRGAHADMLRSSRPFDEAEQAIFRAELDRAYRRFLELVAAGRKRTVEQIKPLAGGRVWSGVDAHENGLVDRLGGLDVALDEVRARAGKEARGAQVVLFGPRPRLSLGTLLGLLPGARALAPALRSWAEMAQVLGETREPLLALGWLWPGL